MGLWESAPGTFARRSLISEGKALDILTAPAGTGGGTFVLPASPVLARDAAGHPALSLTLILDRAPGAGEDIPPLVREGLLGFTLSLEVPAWALAALELEGVETRPLFVRAARFKIAPTEGGTPLASADGAGVAPRAALSAVLGRDAACRALAAVRGEESGLDARVAFSWRPEALPPDSVAAGAGNGLSRVEISTPLEDILAAENIELDRHLRLIVPGGSGSGLEKVPLRKAGNTSRSGPGGSSLAALGGRITSLSTALHPSGMQHVVPAQALAATHFGRVGSVVLDNAVLTTETRSLPVVQDTEPPIWPDRLDPRRLWYVPRLELIRPTGNDTPAASPFLFKWKQVGVTAGSEAMPGLEGTVLFTLRTTMPAAVQDALKAAGRPPATPVPLSGVSVILEVPFREEGTGVERIQQFPARVEVAGDRVAASVELLDGWVRLCYGTLAYEGFQARPARLLVGWSFDAYVPLQATPQLAFAGKTAATPLLGTALMPGKIAFDPRTAVLHLPNSEVRFMPESGSVRRGLPHPVAYAVKRPGAAMLSSSVAAHALTASAAHHAAVVARPELAIAPALLEQLRKTKFALRSVARGEIIDAFFPCKDNLAAYRRINADGSEEAAGCQDALKLGEISYRQYDEMPELRQDDASGRLCSVYRSLKQPGRYLIAPARWRIARYAQSAGTDRAFRPTAMVYALRDPGADETRYFFSAHLEPDIPLHVRGGLARRLAELAPAGHQPVIDYPTEPSLQAATSFKWGVPEKIAMPQVATQWDGFQVTISAGLADALLLTGAIEKTGIVGEVTFTLPDGSPLTGVLMLDTIFTGPWATGPVEVQALGNRVTLTNRIDVPVDVTDLVADARLGVPVVPVEATLAPGEKVDVQLPVPAVGPYPVAAPRPSSPKLEETNLFVENVTTNVIFVNLVNYSNHGIAKLAVEARLCGEDHVYEVELDEGQHATLEIVLPLTSYVQSQTLEMRLIVTGAQGEAVSTGWQSWDLEVRGSVISITPDMLPAATRTRAMPPSETGRVNKPGPTKAWGKEGEMDQATTRRGGPRGLSIHIGLNHIDPAAYDGSDGELLGCINDANAMKKIAQDMGYDPISVLLDENATSDAVLEAIGSAAKKLSAGDHLLITYSGHGGQIPDETYDEEDYQDETWALYDRQMLDDELYAMWGKFAAGVRIFVLSDSCHSGTVVRMMNFQNLQKAAQSARGVRGAPPRIKALKLDTALKNYRDNKLRYRNIQWVTGSGKGANKGTVGASVLLISGCQDNQYSQDGDQNGLFTETLLKIWNNGNFEGSHRDFHQAISAEMPSEQTPNFYTVGASDADFENMKPFVISKGGQQPTPQPVSGPYINGPKELSSSANPPSFDVGPSPYSYFAVEVATELDLLYGGTGQRTDANSYASWQDVHMYWRGSGSKYTLPSTVWDKLKKAQKLYYRIWATQYQEGAKWEPFKVAMGAAPITIKQC